MVEKTLHITNGSSLTNYLQETKIEGDIITWHEMLCEGPTVENIDSEEFLNQRKAFLNDVYNIEYDEYEFKSEINRFNDLEPYSEIVLWFEYDLFCHINMVAVISLLEQKKNTLPLYLVCSGRVEGEKGLKGLPELKPKQLLEHYSKKVKLNIDDIALAQKTWRIYCGSDHNLLKPLIVRSSSFEYLSNCLKAHIKRFADTRSGINTLEYNILELVKKQKISSRHHLLGYALHYQGYYGFGDTQLKRIIDHLEIFFLETETELTLNRNGHLAIEHQKNFFSDIDVDFMFGGINKNEYQFNKKENKLIKTIVNAH